MPEIKTKAYTVTYGTIAGIVQVKSITGMPHSFERALKRLQNVTGYKPMQVLCDNIDIEILNKLKIEKT